MNQTAQHPAETRGTSRVPPGHAHWGSVLTATVVALMLRLFRLDDPPLWFDETITAQWLALPWRDLIAATTGDKHPPLYFLLVKAWAAVAGDSAWALRVPSAVSGAAAVPLIAAAAGRLHGPTAARWGAWCAALSPFLLHHGQEARMYALAGALAAGHFLLVARFVSSSPPRTLGAPLSSAAPSGPPGALGLGFVVTSLALVGTHYYAVLLLGGEALALLVLRPRPLRSWLPATATACVLAVIAVGAATLRASHEAAATYDTGVFAFPGALWSLVAGYELLPNSADLHAHGLRAVAPYVPVALVAVVPFCIAMVLAWRTLPTRERLLVAIPFATAVGAPFVLHLVFGVGVHPRYLTPAVPLLLVLFAVAAAGTQRTQLRIATANALVAVMACASALHLANPRHGREDIDAAGAWLDAHVPIGEEILITSDEMADLARFHWPQRRFRLFPERRTVVDDSVALVWAAQLPFAHRDRAIYLIGREWLSDPAAALQDALTRRYARCGDVRLSGIRILCLVRAPMQQAHHRRAAWFGS